MYFTWVHEPSPTRSLSHVVPIHVVLTALSNIRNDQVAMHKIRTFLVSRTRSFVQTFQDLYHALKQSRESDPTLVNTVIKCLTGRDMHWRDFKDYYKNTMYERAIVNREPDTIKHVMGCYVRLMYWGLDQDKQFKLLVNMVKSFYQQFPNEVPELLKFAQQHEPLPLYVRPPEYDELPPAYARGGRHRVHRRRLAYTKRTSKRKTLRRQVRSKKTKFVRRLTSRRRRRTRQVV